jgi:hypothetical protein
MGHSEYDPRAKDPKPWNAGRKLGAKRALKPQQVWAIRFWLDRKGRLRAGMPPQLFDLDADPGETRDLGTDPGYAGLVRDCEAELRRIVDPELADRTAREDQAAKIKTFGGRAAIIAKGAYSYSPVRGVEAVYT